MATFESKLSKTRAGERTRIWLQGARLDAAGFKVGKLFRKQWKDNGSLVLSVVTAEQWQDLAHAERGTVSGKGALPIIDITGAKVAAHFSGATVAVRFTAGKVAIGTPEA